MTRLTNAFSKLENRTVKMTHYPAIRLLTIFEIFFIDFKA